MTYNHTTTAGRVKKRSKILAAALVLSLSGPVAADFAVPQVAEAQFRPIFAVVDYGIFFICIPWPCFGSFCCGPRF